MNNSYITIIKEKRTALSRKRIPLNQNGCTANFRIGVPFEQNLQIFYISLIFMYFVSLNCYFFRFFVYVIFINFSHLTPYVITITLILSVFVSISFKRLFIEAGHNNF